MVIYLFVCLGVVFSWYAVAVSKEEMNIIKSILFTIVGYVFSHIVFSGGLFWLDQYSIKRTVFLCMMFWLILDIVAIVKHRKLQIDWNIKQYVLPIIISLVSLPFVIQTFEFYGFGQDEGVYQTQAICFIYGITERQLDIEEYYHLESAYGQERLELVTGEDYLAGFYKVYDEDGEYYTLQSEDQAISERSGVFHGIPTFSALLALWGYMFGIRHMMGINTVLYLCSIFMVALVCDRFKLKAIGKAGSLMIFALSPLVIWVSKSALTEIGLTLIWLVFLYFLLGEEKKEILMSAVCIFLYAFYHVSIYAFMPLYVLLYIGLYVYSKNKEYMIAMIGSVFGYVMGYWMMMTVGPQYTVHNYRRIYHLFMTAENVPFIIMAVCVIVIFSGLILLNKKNIFHIKWNEKKVAWGIRIFIGISIAVLVYRLMRTGINLHQLSNVTLISYFVLTGIIISGLVFANMFIFTEQWIKDKKLSVLFSIFLYCIIVYSVYFVPVAPYYYYYTRYLVMYLPLIAIMGGIILNRNRMWMGVITVGSSVLFMLPYDFCLMEQKDDSRVEWNTLSDLAESFNENDKLVMDDELFQYYYFPLKAMAGVDIYPVFEELDMELSELSEAGTRVYYLTVNNAAQVEGNYNLKLRIVNTKSEDDNMRLEDYLNDNHNKITLLPEYFEETKEVIQLYQYN